MSVDRDLVEAVDLGAEAFDVLRLAAGGDRRQRAAVEGALEGEDAVFLRMAVDRVAPARHLDRRLVGLGPRIGEEDEIGEGRVGEPPRQPLAVGDLEQVGGVPELARLLGQGRDEPRMRVAERVDGDAGAEVEISLAGRRRQPAAFAALEGDVGSRVDRNDGGRHLFSPLLPASLSSGVLRRRRAAQK